MIKAYLIPRLGGCMATITLRRGLDMLCMLARLRYAIMAV
jgi:hypothetical protein